MRKMFKILAIGSLALFGATACADLEVANLNDPDAGLALSSAGDVESLIVGSFNTWWSGHTSYGGPGAFMSNQTFQHNAPWSNFGMEQYGRLPRVGIVNDVADSYYNYFTRTWYYSYRALAAVSDGLRSLDDPDIADELGPAAVSNLRAFGKFVQGISHGTVALLYDRGFVVDENTDLTQPQEPVEYTALMDASLAYLDEAASLAGSASEIPTDWTAMVMSPAELGRLAKSYKARYRAQVARTASERAAVNWSAVIADVDAGLQATLTQNMDWDSGWYYSLVDYGTWPSWSQISYWMYGMADQSGNYQEWLSLPLGDKSYRFADGRDVFIVTPDTRFPQGATFADQDANPGAHYRITPASEQGNTWKKPERGVWRWSWYKNGFTSWLDYGWNAVFDQPHFTLAELRLLKAEALYRTGDMAGAAAIVNETRTLYGLNATDAGGANTSCVPKLPNGQCGDLLEMLKWEKRHETQWTGIAGGNWWFDGRGWGDLWKDTPTQFPVPCKELQVLQMLPCNTYGGPGGEGGAPMSTYAFPFEG